ncbi:MAG: DUF763 domain-containing protein [Desulfurococcales archaeon]|jgi:hypothetical protein|nr:DUF763 domain-containing protein [Desulfurococcales archaeon]
MLVARFLLEMSGISDLPLHDGHVPKWLLAYMEKLASAILKVMYEIHGPDKIIEYFSDPLWFQAFNNVIGMDWDSSGSTTVVTAVVKKITWKEDLGFLVLGGKGEHSKEVVDEIPLAVKRLSLGEDFIDKMRLVSRIGAKIDSVLLQDGYTLYHHALFISERGGWTIIQQGMKPSIKMARRYHLNHMTADLTKLLDPHSGVASNNIENPLNLVDNDSLTARGVIEDLLKEDVSKIIKMIREVNALLKGLKSLNEYTKLTRHLENKRTYFEKKIFSIPYYRPINITDEMIKTLNEAQLKGAEKISEILQIKGFGPETMRALTLVADLIFNTPPSNRDPVTHPIDPFKYSYAHGGKDGVPYKVRRDLLEKTILTLEEAVERAKIGDHEKMKMLNRLAQLSRYVLDV